MWGDGGGGLPGPAWAPGGFRQEGTARGRSQRLERESCRAPADPVCDLRGRVPRGAGSSVALAGGLGVRTALPVAESATRGHSARPPGEAGRSLCFQSSLLFLFLDNCFSQTSKK